ncbi:Vacuolar protein sorting-associated protein 33B [Perkinsus olseni]|uniref:malate dehydrogenase n=2 Tax=Perkinsus olseni TaxID=32597 RepID=A0A7J6QCE3_PEROL|nr:Vacuolar protein sorting-associated protein 33B [Perkinsus olseni]
MGRNPLGRTSTAAVSLVVRARENTQYIDVGEPILPERKTVVLNSNDKLFDRIRDLRMEVLGPLLHKKASQIQETYSEKDRLSDIPQMKMYMDKFKSAQADHASLADHVNLASFTSALTQMPWFQQQWQVEDGLMSGAITPAQLVDIVNDMMEPNLPQPVKEGQQPTPGSQPLDRVLRLICLCSVVNGGIKMKTLKALTKNLIEWYGPKLIVPLLHHMTACGLLKVSSDTGADLVSSGSGKWQRMKQAFNLVVAGGGPEDDDGESDPGSNIAADTGIAYAYSGYAPLSVRLVELTESEPNGWRGAAENLNLLWGPAIEVACGARPEVLPGSVDQEGTVGKGDKVVVVCFVGGVTYGEIAALRRLSAVERKGRRFLVVTTEMLSHEKLFNEIINEQAFSLTVSRTTESCVMSEFLLFVMSILQRPFVAAASRAMMARGFSSQVSKVCLLGASGGIGQPLALLLKMNPAIKELALYDIKQAATPCKGVAADISHIDSNAKVTGYAGEEEIGEALRDAKLVIMTAGVPRKPGMTRDDLFDINAKIVMGLSKSCAEHAPKATLCVVSNPVNSTVPIAAETLKKAGVFDWRRLVGVTTLDSVRANTFFSNKINFAVDKVEVPVIGGHAGETIMPVFSHAFPPHKLDAATVKQLDERIQNAGTEVVEAKQGAGSATLSMAYAAAVFVEKIVQGQTAYAFVKKPVGGLEYFAAKCKFGNDCEVAKVEGLPELNEYEKERLQAVEKKLEEDIQRGVDFAKKH